MIDDNGKGQQEKEEARTKERNGKDIMHLKTKELGGKKNGDERFFGALPVPENAKRWTIFVSRKSISQQVTQNQSYFQK